MYEDLFFKRVYILHIKNRSVNRRYLRTTR